MAGFVKRAVGLHPEAQARRAEVTARAAMGRAWWARRRAEIAALPVVVWKGTALRTILCHGTSGRGSHRVNVPAALLWQLVAVEDYFCPYHAADRLARIRQGPRKRGAA